MQNYLDIIRNAEAEADRIKEESLQKANAMKEAAHARVRGLIAETEASAEQARRQRTADAVAQAQAALQQKTAELEMELEQLRTETAANMQRAVQLILKKVGEF